MRYLLLSLLAVGLVAGVCRGQETENSVPNKITKLDEAATEFSYRGDAAGLANMLTDDFVAVGANGTVVSKSALIARMQPRRLIYKRLEVTDRRVRVYGDAAVVVGRSIVEFANDTNGYGGLYRYMRMYVRQHGRWKICSQQISRISGDVPPVRTD